MSLRRTILLTLVCVASASAASAAEPAALARARALYNASNYDGAIEAATAVRQQPQWADAAALVVARSHLERYRQRADASDLTAARETLSTIRSANLTPRDQVDLLIGLGQSLYLGELYGAAAELFENALARDMLLAVNDRLMLLDWWATALDREAQTRAADRRPAMFAQIAGRMTEELRRDAGNRVANYWLAVAARGTGDIEGAWDAAVAAWVRSTLAPNAAATLRTDLDRLVTQALIPERARLRPAREQTDALASLRSEWDLVKEQWK